MKVIVKVPQILEVAPVLADSEAPEAARSFFPFGFTGFAVEVEVLYTGIVFNKKGTPLLLTSSRMLATDTSAFPSKIPGLEASAIWKTKVELALHLLRC